MYGRNKICSFSPHIDVTAKCVVQNSVRRLVRRTWTPILVLRLCRQLVYNRRFKAGTNLTCRRRVTAQREELSLAVETSHVTQNPDHVEMYHTWSILSSSNYHSPCEETTGRWRIAHHLSPCVQANLILNTRRGLKYYKLVMYSFTVKEYPFWFSTLCYKTELA